MINKIVEYIFGSKQDKLKKLIKKKYERAIEYQRNGDINKYSFLMKEIDNLKAEVKYERQLRVGKLIPQD